MSDKNIVKTARFHAPIVLKSSAAVIQICHSVNKHLQDNKAMANGKIIMKFANHKANIEHTPVCENCNFLPLLSFLAKIITNFTFISILTTLCTEGELNCMSSSH